MCKTYYISDISAALRCSGRRDANWGGRFAPRWDRQQCGEQNAPGTQTSHSDYLLSNMDYFLLHSSRVGDDNVLNSAMGSGCNFPVYVLVSPDPHKRDAGNGGTRYVQLTRHTQRVEVPKARVLSLRINTKRFIRSGYCTTSCCDQTIQRRQVGTLGSL